ncbi:MAG: Cna B-type domain-containing protein, partial [Clostridia bacterium]|nr:Cna B-type domain-containing protein [Clostridia bacterium]
AAGTYKVEVTGDYKTGITITNTHTPEKISVNATKVYDDNNDQDGIREDATFNLYKKVGNSDKEQVANSTKTISKDATGEGLVATWSNLPKYENGNEIEYSVEEELTDRVTGKDAAGTYKVETKGDYKTGITITNKHTPEKINISVNKKWITKDATTSMPNKLIVKLMNGKNEVETVELNEDNKWKHTFANKDKCSNGKNINYTIEEESVKGFYQSDLDKNVDKDGNVTYTLTNSPSLEIEKKSPTDGDTIEVGKNITYTVTITNHNDIPETTKLQESIPENTKLVGDIEITATGESKITTKTMPTDITVPANGKTTIKFTVEVQNSALGSGNTITNTAKIGENENIISSETIKNNAQKELKIYQVETENQGQTVVVVIDMSLSMASAINPAINSDTMAYAYNQTRWFYLTEALDTFIEEFLSNSNNRISIVGYNANTTKLCDFTNNKNTAKNSYKNVFTQTHFNNLQKAAQCGNVAFNAQKEGSFQTDLSSSPDGYNIDVDALTYLGNGKWSKTVTVGSGADRVTYTAGQKIPGATETTECLLGSGTNITKGLSAANSELENNVIYTSVVLMTDGEANRDKGNEATNAASIRAKGADLYTIGFTSDVKTLESTVGSANITKNYTATTANQLSNAFEDIAGKITNLPVVTKTTTTGTVNISDINIKNDSDVEIIAKVNGTEKKIFDGKGSTFKSTYMTGNTFNFKQLLIDKNVDPDSEITMTINTEI